MIFCEQILALPHIVIAPFSVKRALHPVLTLSVPPVLAMYYQIVWLGVLPTFQFTPNNNDPII